MSENSFTIKRQFPGSLAHRLLMREMGSTDRSCTRKGIYGDIQLVKDLDIVNELRGHSGCVNALTYVPFINHDAPVCPNILTSTQLVKQWQTPRFRLG